MRSRTFLDEATGVVSTTSLVSQLATLHVDFGGRQTRAHRGRTSTSEERVFEKLLEEVRTGAVRGVDRVFRKGEVVFHEGDLGDTLHLIVAGLFAVRTATATGRHLIISVLGPGDVVGEFAVFSTQGKRTSEVSSLVPGRTVTVDRAQLKKALRTHPELVEDLLATVISKAEITQQRLVDLLSIPADLRVLRAVLLLDEMDRPDAAIPVTQNDLANFAATTRPTANRVLREESKRGTLELLRGRVTVLDRERLARRVGAELETS
jgi:CRP/FNR family cyclic AMP-dependent transcriptional regulator